MGFFAARRRLAIALTALGCGAAIAACGSASKTSSASRAGSLGIKFADCMRSHGVPNFPDPTGGVQQIPPGVSPASPAFRSAQQSCSKLVPGGGPSLGAPSAQAHAQLLKVSKCMRAHGISGFPDPSTGTPPVPGSGYSAVIGHGGYFLAIPSTIDMSSPAFKETAGACNFGPKRPAPKVG